LQISIRSDDVHRDVGIKLVLLVVPIELLTSISRAILEIPHSHTSTQLPKLLIIPISRVGCDVEVYIKLGIIAFEKNPFEKLIARRGGTIKDTPLFCHDFITHYTRITDELGNSVTRHEGERIALSYCSGLGRRIVAACSKTNGKRQKEKIAELAHVKGERRETREDGRRTMTINEAML